MLEIGLIALGIYLLTKTGKKSDVIAPGDVTTTTASRTGSDEPTSLDYDYATTADEADNNPWTWANPPAVFTKVPLSPGSRSRWLRLAQLWREYKELQFDIYALVRDAAQTSQERGGGDMDVSADVQQVKAQANVVMQEIRRLAGIQNKVENEYKSFLNNTYGTAQTMQYYQQRKAEIVAGIWPSTETQIVPAKKNGMPSRVNVLKPDVNQETTSVTMGNKRIMNTVDIERDAAREALPPGKRFTDAGTVYYEYRQNRSDYPGSI
jgi:hypothetical protein